MSHLQISEPHAQQHRKERLPGAVGFGADFPEEMELKWDFLGWVGFGIDGREGEADN